jgi:hypothetical protein
MRNNFASDDAAVSLDIGGEDIQVVSNAYEQVSWPASTPSPTGYHAQPRLYPMPAFTGMIVQPGLWT